jgi:hypothetical protein
MSSIASSSRLTSHYSQILHYLSKNRPVFTTLGVIKPLSAAHNKYDFDIGAAGRLGDYEYPIELGAAEILHLIENHFQINTAGLLSEIESSFDIGAAGLLHMLLR